MGGPDLAGFADAQHRLRDAFGERVDFFYDAQVTFPPGTAIDPQTGRPFDPTVEGSATVASASAAMNVAWRARDKQADSGPAGVVERDHVILIGDPSVTQVASGAVEFDVRDQRFLVEATKDDPIAPDTDDRCLVYGRRKS